MRLKISFFLLISFLPMMAQTDVTSSIINPEFDGRSFAGWQQQGMQCQSNNDFSGKSNYAYVERWVSNSGNLPDTYIKQTLSGLTKGRYTLTVAAQHIKQGSSTAATGGVIFADWAETTVTTAGDYSVTFDVLTDDVTIGFKVTNGTGNWMACDNFRLVRTSTNVSYMRTGLSNLVSVANTLASQSMDATVKSTLSSAISNANRYTSSGTAANVQSAAATLKTAMLAAERSIFATKTSTTGAVPTVVTNTRYARGATMIFGRSTVSGSSSILEQGFCYSTTNATPTVADERTTRYVSNGGNIYCLDNLTPSTLYYIRAYAVTTGYKVGYGDVIKVYTLPKGSVTYGYGNEGDALTNARISQSAMGVATMWSNLTSISGANLNVHYASGTPTADCSYGGYIRVGPTESYQATGTLLHEMGHGIGVGTHSTYYGDIRSNSSTGIWYGKRATRFLQFWDNSDGVKLTGDGTHMWATSAAQSLSYTINGANEDAHSDASYYGNSLLMQAIVEDGLAPVSGNLQGLAYTFEHEDGKAYFIRNSDANYGLKTSYLVDNNGTLQLKALSMTEAQTASNNAMWNITFNPSTQTYRIKNQTTGRYIYYASDNANNGFKAATSTSNEIDLRLQLSFVDVVLGQGSSALTVDCYHLMRATSTPSPQAMCAKTTTMTGSTAFSNTNAATAQRWIITDADGLENMDDAIRQGERYNLDELIAAIRNLASKSHTEDVAGANATLENKLQEIEAAESTADASTIVTLEGEAKAALMTFMQNTTPTGNPYDITFLIKNAGMDGTEGWSGTTPTIDYSCGEYYQKAFDVYQTITGAPAGRYMFKLQGYQRPGSAADTYSDYVAGTNNYPITTQVYVGSDYALVNHIGKDAQSTKVGTGNESEVGESPVKYVPNNMQAAAAYFNKGLYDNSVETTLTSNNQTLQFGIRGASYVSSDWTIFDNYRLYYYGGGNATQDPAADLAEYFDITNAMAPWLCTGSLRDWTNDGMYTNYNNGGAPYTNNADGARIDFPFIERWTGSGNSLANTKIQQTIRELPNGTYYIRGSFIACQQANSGTEVSGVTFYAGDSEVSVATGNGTPERYSLKVEVTDGTLTYGLKTVSTTANWIAMDNFSLLYAGTEDEYYASATNDTPVRVPIGNPTFDQWNTNGWAMTGNWSAMNADYDNFNSPFAEWWVGGAAQADRSLYQTMTLREGVYTLKAAVEAVRQDQTSLTVSGVTLRFDDESVACHTADHAPEIFQVKNVVEAGDHTFGLYVESTNANWVAVDNFRLYYYGIKHLIGDVNRDGFVNVTDVVCLTNYILSPGSIDIDLVAADANEDGSINITDVVEITTIILNND
ncbi:MAG: dockerin type I repeat-containing protein [Prevotella sp.]|nr:dockerin type I repeat-containing protein [Prevotella sp.]